MNYKPYLIVVIFLIFSVTIKAQVDFLKFDYVTVDNGLSSNNIRHIYKDKRGFMWFANQVGLDRYDGYRVHSYPFDQKNPDGLWGEATNSIVEDVEGNLWVSTNQCVNKYVLKKDAFKHYFVNDTANFVKNIQLMTFLNDSLLWISHDKGINVFNIRTEKIVKKYTNDPKNKRSIKINGLMGLVKDPRGDIWLSQWPSGLSKYNVETDDFTHYEHDPLDSNTIFKNAVFNICPDDDNGVWVVSMYEDGIARLDLKTHKFTNYNYKSIGLAEPVQGSRCSKDIEGNVWFCSFRKGVIKYDRRTKKFSNYRREIGVAGTLSENLIGSIFSDKEGNLWLGTINNGVNYTNILENKSTLYSFSHFKNTNDFYVNSYCRDINKNVWIATTKGLLFFDIKKLAFKPIDLPSAYSSEIYTHIKPISKDEIMLKSVNIQIALNIYTFKTRELTEKEKKIWEENFTIFDEKGNIYVNKYNKIYAFKGGYVNKDTITVLYDSSIVSWKPLQIITFEVGYHFPFAENDENAFFYVKDKVYKQNLKTLKAELFLDNIWGDPEQSINSIFIDGDSLRIMSNNRCASINIQNKAKNIFTFRFLREKETVPRSHNFAPNQICLSSFRGIFLFDFNENIRYRPHIFVDNSRNADFLIKVNDSLFLTEVAKGFALFNPRNFYASGRPAPKVSLTDFYLFNGEMKVKAGTALAMEITTLDEMVLKSEESVFSFEFALLTYTNPDKIQYAYTLEGYDKGWNYIGARKVATYTNLPPGEYVFKFRGKGENTQWSKDKSIRLIIKPAFWQTWWFKVLCFILFVFLIWLIIKIQLYRVKKQKERLEKLVKIRTQEIVEKNYEILAQNEEIKAQNEEIEAQREKLQEVYEEVTDNIQTAKRIQESILPKEETIKQYLPEHFILFRPKDIVSGDFYWFFTKSDKIYIAAVDCTGHGVSGAFMSLIGKCLLDQIIIEDPSATAGQILNSLSKLLVRTLQQDLEDAVSKDGMDIALCIIDKEDGTIQFSGANNPLIIKTPDQIQTIKGDPMGIGLLRGKPAEGFTNHIVTIDPTHSYYIFSDGYVSQFGGESGVDKYKISRFRDMIENLTAEDSGAQKMYFENMLDQWQGKTDQTDDILVIGFEITD